jgi:hypothetical protein
LASVALAGPPAIPATPAPVEQIVYARPFTLEEGYKFTWSQEQPNVTSGVLLVLKVDQALVYPRQEPMPVLYAGDRTAERINQGHKCGYAIALVPGEVDLAKAPIWFGTPALPEKIDAAAATTERSLADQAGIKPFPDEAVKAALAKGGEPLSTANRTTLLRDEVASLILEYCPDEKYLADAFRVPVLSRTEPEE